MRRLLCIRCIHTHELLLCATLLQGRSRTHRSNMRDTRPSVQYYRRLYLCVFEHILNNTESARDNIEKKQQSSLLADAVTPIQGVPAHTPLCAHTSDSLRRIIVHYGIEKAQQVRFVWSQQNGQVLSTHNLRKFISLDWLIFLLRPTIINWKLERIRINIFVINCISSNNVQIEVRRGDMLFTADTPQTNWHCLGDMIAIVW